jgi:hypothetical protein
VGARKSQGGHKGRPYGWRRSNDAISGPRRLVRDYQGRRHTVTVGPDGFVWEDASYSSLSAIARVITGQ